MGELGESIGKKDEVKGDSKYVNEDGEIKEKYDDGVEGVESIIKESEKGELVKGKIEEGTQWVENGE
ncbi:FIVAR domain-containing protein, partial [Staphylococcus epidermidis]|uniref:FIVAR domain-containing protein n=1 Tax=Staphylococcus epidermidis TaxID=1282 RepID=UPI0011A8D014